MKSNSKLTGPGWVFGALMLFFMYDSGLLVNLLVIAFVIFCIKLVLTAVPSKEYNKLAKKGKVNLPPALAEKLSKR